MAVFTSGAEPDYQSWSVTDLVQRVQELERQLNLYEYSSRNSRSSPNSPKVPSLKKKVRSFDASKYTSRFIALKFSYLGHDYNGLEHHKNGDKPLPTIEEELWKALVKSKLVAPPDENELEPNWDGLEYSKCGRTDAGVSAFGQVVSLRVRSNRPPTTNEKKTVHAHDSNDNDKKFEKDFLPREDASAVSLETDIGAKVSSAEQSERPFHPIHDELPYIQILNRLLPPDIKILAWCPNPPPNFSARFSCRERRYKYFFTNPAFSPTPSSSVSPHQSTPTKTPPPEGWLDIKMMQQAATHFIGLHDFRNFCKLDPTKQLTNFQRRIFHVEIAEVSPSDQPAASLTLPPLTTSAVPSPPPSTNTPTLYVFTVHGSAFLWHQIRHMVSVLFLVGQGLELPSIIPTLLNTEASPRKPHYEMADDRPLVLWDCIFPNTGVDNPKQSQEDGLEWVYVGEEERAGEDPGATEGTKRPKDAKHGVHGLVPELWQLWRRRKMDEVLAGELLNVAVRRGHSHPHPHSHPQASSEQPDGHGKDSAVKSGKASQKVFLGGDTCKLVGRYVPLMQRPRMDTVEVINERWVEKEGRKVGELGRVEEAKRGRVEEGE